MSCRTGPQLPSERVGILSRVRFRAVFFDAGETLVHPAPSFPELFARIVTNEGYPREPVTISEGLAMVTDEFRRASDEHALWTTTPERSRRFWLGVYDRFLEVLDLPRDDGLADTLYAAFTDRTNYASFDDVRAALTALRDAGVRLGVISNYEAWLEDLLRDLELTSLLSVRVVSGVEGIEKPDLAIFHYRSPGPASGLRRSSHQRSPRAAGSLGGLVTEDRLYTLDEANAQLPDLRERLPRLRIARDGLIAASERIKEAVASDGGGVAEAGWFTHQQTLKTELEQLAERGILLRDPEIGLIDFPAERGGRPVYLCWRLGEDQVAWYHEANAGFGSRKPL